MNIGNVNVNADTSGSQCHSIKSWLESGRSLTALDALYLFGCARLAARIGDLQEQGMPIEKQMIEVVNRAGKTVRVAEYYLGSRTCNSL